MKPMATKDNGGRRSGMDRRRFAYTLYLPERRSGKERRIIPDRRKPRFLDEDMQSQA
jgi:hypothetical protein